MLFLKLLFAYGWLKQYTYVSNFEKQLLNKTSKCYWEHTFSCRLFSLINSCKLTWVLFNAEMKQDSISVQSYVSFNACKCWGIIQWKLTEFCYNNVTQFFIWFRWQKSHSDLSSEIIFHDLSSDNLKRSSSIVLVTRN